jgi:hypothetical protein
VRTVTTRNGRTAGAKLNQSTLCDTGATLIGVGYTHHVLFRDAVSMRIRYIVTRGAVSNECAVLK